MRKIFLFIACLAASFQTKADEGMWTLYNLPPQVYEIMQNEGFTMSYNDLYYGENALKNAVVNFSGYCSGVVVSPNGLVFTNHHCGYEAIQQHSSVKNDYLKYGFLAKSYKDELPNPDLYVDFHLRTVDVTEAVLANVTDSMSERERANAIETAAEALKAAVEDEAMAIHAEVVPYYKGSKYYMSVYQKYSDVRLVCAPPECLGKYGGDTDNWVWPRQTCDFSVFRIYAGKGNLPAEYDKDNVPYQTQGYAKVSTQGYHEGDFCMTFGYPGSTDRYMSSFGIESRMHASNDPRIQVRELKQGIWKEAMNADDAIRIMYSTKYAHSSNYWKNSIGMNKAIVDLGLLDEKKAFEKELTDWIMADTIARGKYVGVLDSLQHLYSANFNNDFTETLLEESFTQGSDLLMLAIKMMMKYDPDDPEAFKKLITSTYKDVNMDLDKKVFAAMLRNYAEQVPDSNFLLSCEETVKGQFNGDYEAFTDGLYARSLFSKPDELAKVDDIRNLITDPMLMMAMDVFTAAQRIYGGAEEGVETNERLLGEAMREMDKSKEYYSDANFTLRMSYGIVEGYSPSKDLTYKYWTNAQSLLDKNTNFPDNLDYVLLPQVKKWFEKAAFGHQYIDQTTGEMQLCFLTNNDITGGNSGSGMFDGKGRLIGLAFDGNWEAMSSDLQFNNELTRCIGVDIRYVLSVIEKYSKGKRLIKELVLE